MTIPTARSITLPRSRKDRNPLMVTSSVFSLGEAPGASAQQGKKDY
jgi:hypothetical protein